MPVETLPSLVIRKVPTAANPTGRMAFYHEDAYNPTNNGYLLSDFTIDLEGDYFHPKEAFGAFRRQYPWNAVTVIDQATNTTYPPSNRITLIGVLIAIGYTPFMTEMQLTQDQIDAINGANAPSASNPFATIADVSGGGAGDPYNKCVNWNTGDSLTFTIDSGAKISSVSVNRILLYAEQDNDNIIEKEWFQSGNNVTLQNVVGTMLIEGDDNIIQFTGTI